MNIMWIYLTAIQSISRINGTFIWMWCLKPTPKNLAMNFILKHFSVHYCLKHQYWTEMVLVSQLLRCVSLQLRNRYFCFLFSKKLAPRPFWNLVHSSKIALNRNNDSISVRKKHLYNINSSIFIVCHCHVPMEEVQRNGEHQMITICIK